MRFTLPLKTQNTSNLREHWAAKHKRTSPQRKASMLATKSHVNLGQLGSIKLVVLMTRIAPSDGLDTDGLQNAMKHTRDGIAAALKVDDATPLIRWDYAQRRGEEYAVEVMINWEIPSENL